MFDLFKKLFKVFNSAQTPWQMSLALSLGMAMGLTPFSGLQTIALIFVVFIINIHLGLFFVSATFFAGLAYIFDPIFEQLGFYILTNESLKELFIGFYNSGLMRLTYFNNTLVMGSSIIAFSLLIPMYFILNKVVYLYRDKIAAKLSQYKIFRTLGIEVTDKKDKFLRLWGVGLFAVIGLLIGLFGYLFMDSLAKSAISSGLAKMTSKSVNIDSVNISFTESRFDINSLEIYDDKQSSFIADNIAINIDFNQLLFSKYHIQNIDVVGMRFNESRVNDAKNTKVSSSPTKASSTSKKPSDAKVSNDAKSDTNDLASAFPTPQTLIDRAGLSSKKTVDDAKIKLKAIEKKYTDAIEKDFSDEEIKSIKDDLKYLKQKIKAKDTSTLSSDIKKIKQLRDTLKEKKHLALKLKKEFKEDKKTVQTILADVKKAGLSDYDNLSQNYNLDADGGANVIGVLFGDKTKSYSASFLKYYKIVKPYLSDDAKDEVIPPRGEGRWIKYKELSSQVDIWVKNVNITGVYDAQVFSANIKDISSNQKLLNKPMTVEIKSDGELVKGLDFGLSKLQSATYTFRADAKTNDYESIDAKAKLSYTKTKFSSKYLKDIKDFDVDMKLVGEIVSPSFDVSSNLDEKLKQVFKQALKQKVAEYKKELKKLINENTKDSLASLTGDSDAIDMIEQKLNAKIGGVTSSQSDLDSTEKKLKDNTKSKLKDKASEFLKKFKF